MGQTASSSFEPQPGVWYRVVVHRDGEQLRGRIWPDGDDEPDVGHVEVTDGALSSGSVGLAGVSGDGAIGFGDSW